MREADESPGDPERQKTLLGVARELALLRSGSHEADRVRLERERWETKQAEVNEKKRAEAERAANWQWRKAQDPGLGRSSLPRQYAVRPQELEVCLQANAGLRRAQDERANHGESNQIKPDEP